ncbi:MAG: T9SS type A sorting domain-containing protein [Candidatus Zixiibacteriota bacterium]|nr:MAG: T9SS type A sorting domain-containing protein [candidate division Zixibacteria bacterium]
MGQVDITSALRRVAALALLVAATSPAFGQAVIADHNCACEFDQISPSTFDGIQSEFRIFYGHTSHGSQIMTGLDILESEDPWLTQPVFHEIVGDLGDAGDVTWVQPTRDFLLANPGFNVAMWSWCGGVSDNTEEGINTYLDAMNQLEHEFPNVVFVYMTGHLDGTGIDGNLYQRNNQIRDYCVANGKVLFDFADIESYDPDGNFYPDGTDACEWCSDWCLTHDCPGCSDCAHSHCFNCYQKGKVFWWMLASLDGWGASVDVDSPTETSLPGSFDLKQNSPNPFNPRTTIEFSLPSASRVSVIVYNILGERIRTLVNEPLPAGVHRVTWDGTDSEAKMVSSGVYFYQLKAGTYTATRKMMLLK